MDRLLTREQVEAWRMSFKSTYPETVVSYTEARRQLDLLCDLALQSLSQEAVRDEPLEELRRLVRLLADLAVTESEIEQEFMHGPRVIFEKGGQIAVRDVLMARKALKRELNAAAESYEAVHPKASDGPAPAAPDVASMVKRAIKEMRFFQSVRSRVPADAQYDEWIALLAKLGQDWVTEPVAWRREWDGDISDVGHMIYVDDPHDRDEPLSRWQPLYAKEPGASDD